MKVGCWLPKKNGDEECTFCETVQYSGDKEKNQIKVLKNFGGWLIECDNFFVTGEI